MKEVLGPYAKVLSFPATIKCNRGTLLETCGKITFLKSLE